MGYIRPFGQPTFFAYKTFICGSVVAQQMLSSEPEIYKKQATMEQISHKTSIKTTFAIL